MEGTKSEGINTKTANAFKDRRATEIASQA